MPDTEQEETTVPPMSEFLGKDIIPLTQPRTEDDIEAIGISVPKDERALLKTTEVKTYEKLKEKAEEGIKTKFALLKPIDHASNVKDFKDLYGVLTRVDELHQNMVAYDIDDVFKVPSSFKDDLPDSHFNAID